MRRMKDGSNYYIYIYIYYRKEIYSIIYEFKDFAYYVEMGLAYKVMRDTFTEAEICDISEIQLFPDQYLVGMLPKGSPLHDAIAFGYIFSIPSLLPSVIMKTVLDFLDFRLRRVKEVGIMQYQRKVWYAPKPACIKQLRSDDLTVYFLLNFPKLGNR